MDLRALLCFQIAVELGTISKASSYLRIAQPALTRQLQKLEHSLGVELLHRTHRGVKPTAAGQLLFDRTSHLQRDLAEIRREVTNLSRQVAGSLHVAVQPPLSTLLIPDLVAKFMKQHPGVSLHVVDGYSADVTDGLISDKLDVAIVDSPSHTVGLTITPLWIETLRLIGPREGLSAKRSTHRPVSLGEVSLLPLILPTQRYTLRRLVDAAFAGECLKVDPSVEADGPAMILALVKAGLGYTLLPTCGCQTEIEADRLQVWDTSPGIMRPISIVTRSALADELKVSTLIRLARTEAMRLVDNGTLGTVEVCPERPPASLDLAIRERKPLRLVKST